MMNHGFLRRSLLPRGRRCLAQAAAPTFANQTQLPRLPVPSLAQTLARYTDSLLPLLPAAELQRSRSAVAEFGRPGGVGERLQQRLLAYAHGKEVVVLIAELARR